MKKLLLAVSIAFLLVNSAKAQTITKSLEWDDDDPLTLVNTYTTTLKIDSASPITLTPTCATVGTTTHCKNPVQLISGSHIFVLTLTDPSGASASAGFNYKAPATPSNLVIKITITVP